MGDKFCQASLVALLSLVMLGAIVEPCQAEPISTTDSRTVVFTGDYSDMGIEGQFPMTVEWNDYFKASENEALTIAYSLAAQAATLNVAVPLSNYLGWLGLEDIIIPVPLGNTPLGILSMSLTSSAGIPSWAASLDLRLSGTVKTSSLCCSSGFAFVQTDASSLTWSTWTTKSAQVLTSDSPGGSIRATFTYAFGIGLTLSILGVDVIDIIPSTTVLDLTGSPSVETVIDVPTPTGISSLVADGIIVAVVAGGATVVLLVLLRRKRGPPALTMQPEEYTPKTQ